MASTYDTKIPVKSGSVSSDTVNGASAKGSLQGSPSGKLAAAQAGKGGDLGGNIPGFGSGKPDASTINGSSACGAGFGSISGNLAAQPATKSGVPGFSNGGIKAGKI